ncbi:hypothetical protein ACJJTC_008310 [Scirpophaga incertulas]
MWFLIPILLLSPSAISQEYSGLQAPQKASAASAAQIRFAEENKYDDTGPGSKGPEFAYDTYKTLEDALVSFIDDPDTKLPEFEKAKGLQSLFKSQQLKDKFGYNLNPNLNQIKPLLESTFDNKNPLFNVEVGSRVFQPNSISFEGLRQLQREKLNPLKLQRFQPIKSNPINFEHFIKGPVVNNVGANVDPKYSFSYGVHLMGRLRLKAPHKMTRKFLGEACLRADAIGAAEE